MRQAYNDFNFYISANKYRQKKKCLLFRSIYSTLAAELPFPESIQELPSHQPL